MIGVFILCVAVLRFLFIPFASRDTKEKPFIVRVRLAHDAGELEISSEKGVKVYDMETGDLLEDELNIKSGIKVLFDDSGIQVGEKIFNCKAIRFSPLNDAGFTLKEILFGGDLDIIRTDNGLDAVNRVDLEEYLMGVLPREIYHFWPFSSIKAQAIASRSFAVYEAMRRKNRNYDLTADTFSQVYGGRTSHRWRTTKAVKSTQGKVLVYNGKIFPAYFHSCCGGHTQDISRVWGSNSEPLGGGKCRWCRWSPHFRWRTRVFNSTILENLNSKGYYLKRIDNIKTGPRDESGRLFYVRIRSGNKWFEIKAGEFRSIIGRRIIKSGNFRVKKYPKFYLFSGYGWGHGVGMCQWGALGLSLRRWSAEKILKQYYPGTEIMNLGDVIDGRRGSRF